MTGKSEKSETQIVRRTVWWGLLVNLLLFAAKLAAGLLGGSRALVADAVHSLSDGVTDIAILAGAGFWSRPADSRHPYGHRRIETIVTILIGGVLAAAAVGILYDALSMLQEGRQSVPGLPAMAVAAVSIVVKETLYRWTLSKSRVVRSRVLKANAWHHRTDALSSIPTLLAVGTATVFPAWAFVDRVGAALVAVFILQAAFAIVWPALRELIDTGAPSETRRAVQRIAEATEGVVSTHALRTRYTGARLQVDLHVQVDGAISVRSGHDIAEAVSTRLMQAGLEIVDVVVHIEPARGGRGGRGA